MSARAVILGVALVLAAATACQSPPRMTLESTAHPAAQEPREGPPRSRGCGPEDRKPVTVLTGDAVRIHFDKPVEGRATDQYWIQLVPAETPDDDTRGRVILPRGATTAELRASNPGDYEVRLHGSYPAKEHALVVRAPVKIAGYPVGTGAGAVVPP